jgi:hypothetical protein
MTQVSALRAGEVDLLNSVSPELVRVLERDRSVTVLSGVQTTPMVAMLQVSKALYGGEHVLGEREHVAAFQGASETRQRFRLSGGIEVLGRAGMAGEVKREC